MKIIKDLYFYPWASVQENNANTVFINGPVPTLIDPGYSHLLDNVLEGMSKDGLDPRATRMAIFTHSHPDHLEGINRLGDSILRAIGKDEYEFMQSRGNELFMAGSAARGMQPFEILLHEGPLELGDKTLNVILTPGHSAGSICLYWKKEKVLISGDTIFNMGVGRTDLPGGSMDQLAQSIKTLSKLDIEYLIPGHGEMLKGKAAIQKNFEMILTQFFR